MNKKTKILVTSLSLSAVALLGSSAVYSVVNADAITGSANVTYTPGDTPIPGDGWEIIIPTSYDFTAGNNPKSDGSTGQAVEGTVKLTDPYGNTYNGDKTVDVTVTSANNDILKDANGNGNATYQLQDDTGTILKSDGTTPIASLTSGNDNSAVNAALTKAERSKATYSDTLTFTAAEKTT